MSLNGLTLRRHSNIRKRLPKHDPAVTDTEDPFAAALSSFFNDGGAVATPRIHKTATPPKAVTPTEPTSTPSPPGAPIDTPLTNTSSTTPTTTPTTSIPALSTNTNIKSPTSSTIPTTTGHSITTGVKAQPSANSPSTATSTPSNSTGVAIGVTLTVVALCAIGAILWLLRRRRIRERAQWRNSWNAGFQANSDSKRHTWLAANSTVSANMSERRSYEPVTPTTPNLYKPLPDPSTPRGLFVAPPIPEPVTITMPSSTVNNPIHEAPKLIGINAGTDGSNEMARVRRGFLPSLPDELPISIGEMVQVLTAYDDGWSHCQNGRGEKGMVPLECLERKVNGGGYMARQEGVSGQKRMSRRASSLYVGVVPQHGY